MSVLKAKVKVKVGGEGMRPTERASNFV